MTRRSALTKPLLSLAIDSGRDAHAGSYHGDISTAAKASDTRGDILSDS